MEIFTLKRNILIEALIFVNIIYLQLVYFYLRDQNFSRLLLFSLSCISYPFSSSDIYFLNIFLDKSGNPAYTSIQIRQIFIISHLHNWA